VAASIETVRFGRFHRRLAVYANGGLFCDGYILSGFGFALPTLQAQIPMSTSLEGLVAAAPLAGIFLGGLVFGYITDLVGRRFMFLADLAAFVVASLLLAFASTAAEVIALRFVLGVAIGADYAIASALIGEFTPMKQRGATLASTQVAWFVGALASFIVGALLAQAGPQSWRFILASSAVPAAMAMLLRSAAPESPRWLASKGRHEEAQAVLTSLFGAGVGLGDVEPEEPTTIARVIARPYGGRVLFVGVMWLLQVTPFFAIYTFEPQVLDALRLSHAASVVSSVVITAFFLIGSILGMRFIDSWGRRPLAIASFAASALAFAVLALASDVTTIAAAFIFYALAMGPAFCLELVYPTECFPTEVRATAAGIATAISRIGAAAGTFVLPIALAHAGASTVMWASCVLSIAGFAIASLWAPETKGLTLDQSSAPAFR
jgi:MFS transporter, putative metabolite transport protein